MAKDSTDSAAKGADGKTDPADNPPPGPTDHGREGGMATREVTPELVESDDED